MLPTRTPVVNLGFSFATYDILDHSYNTCKTNFTARCQGSGWYSKIRMTNNVDNFIWYYKIKVIYLYSKLKNYIKNINQKSLDHKFYGKKIRTFTDLEIKLFEVDLMMSMTLMVIEESKKGNERMEEIFKTLGTTRFSICCELLGYYPEELNDTISIKTFLGEIEKSDYGYEKFLKDQQENTKLIPKEEMDIINNLIKNESLDIETIVNRMSESEMEVPSYTWN